MVWAVCRSSAFSRTWCDLLDDGDVCLVDGQNKILLLIREHAGKHIDGGNVRPAYLPDEEHSARRVGDKMQFLLHGYRYRPAGYCR